MADEKYTTDPKSARGVQKSGPYPPEIDPRSTGVCGGEKKQFDPQRSRRVVDGVIIEEWL